VTRIDPYRVLVILALIGFWSLVLAALWIACRLVWP
jgi:hypothetical protein